MFKPISLIACLMFASCGSTGHVVTISVNPPESSLYINGKRVGTGDRFPHTLEFGDNQRIYVQATARDFNPEFRWVTVADINRLNDRNLPLSMTLSPR